MSTSSAQVETTGLEVAVIGAACRFPGARDLEEYWSVVREGRETIRRFTAEELIQAGLDPDLVDRPGYVRANPILGEADLFDAAFFNYSPREAEVIDPQGRMMLELAWHALESAGCDPRAFDGLIGVYAGGRLSSYMLQVFRNPEVLARVGDLAVQTGGDKDYLAPRISYKLDLGGPSVNVQTACSTGLVAVHLACQSLVAGECDLALAGGSSLAVPEIQGYSYIPGGVASASGRIRAFDAGADGTIFGNGLGLVALRRLEDALADRDPILAVIKGSAVSNDGSGRVGFTAPGVDGQRRVIRAAQIAGEIEADTISYVEAHGTGTPIGDPIEIEALTKAFRETTDRRGFCAVASVKSNIGHLSAAAGIAGLIKAVLALKHRQLPPSINFERPNPQIDFDSSPFYIDTELRDWTVDGGPRRAGVSAFGIGGTNAHVILEEPPAPAPSEPSHRSHQLVVLSARSSGALAAATENLAAHLKTLPEERFADAVYTLQRGRQAFDLRRAAVCRGAAEAASALAGERPEAVLTGTVPEEPRPVVFLFSGQGSQYPGMGSGLYRAEPVYREEVDRCAGLLEPHLGLDLRELLSPQADPAPAAERLDRTALTQPALFTVEYALARLWQSWGVEPVAMIGHSIGEYVAACLAGVFSLEDALALVAARGRLMQEQPPGAMLAVPLPEAELAARLGPEISVAAVNAPGRTVVSGLPDAVGALRAGLEAEGVACRPLHTSHAFHSAMMEPMLPAFVARFDGVELAPPAIPFASNFTGTWITADEATDPGYWARHVRHAVRFADGLATVAAEGARIYLEVGPGNSLTTLARRNPAPGQGTTVLSSMRHPRTAADDAAVALETLGRLWLAGVAVDWKGFHAREVRSRVALPAYPFERRSYWVEAAEGGLGLGASAAPPRKADLGDWFSLPSWRPSVVPLPAGEGEPEERGGVWVLFAAASGPSAGLAEALEGRLAPAGRSAVRVEPGAAFETVGPGRYRVGPEAESYGDLLEAVARDAGPAERLVHLWNVGEGPDGFDRDLDRRLEPAFWSLLALARALAGQPGGAPAGLAVVTTGVQQVAGEEVSHPERATVLGPVQVIPREIPRLAAAAFDLGAEIAAGEGLEEQAEALLHELEAGLPDPVVAYRGGERWVRDLAPIHLAPAAPERLRVRRGGTYLITGGLGGFGRTFAEFLAREHGARLVLLGRTPLPERARWDAAAAGDDPRTAGRIRAVRELEQLGAEVMVEAADVTDPESLRAAVARARARFGPIHGVIHAAGVPGGGMIQLKEREAAARVLAPKLHGTLALEQALREEEPDFLVLCSSTIALLGTFGQVDYCAANSFLDAYARSRRGRGRTYAVALNWGAWREVGMAVETTLPAGASRALGTAAAPGEPEAGANFEPFEGEGLHPLLDRLLEDTPRRKVFAVRMAPETHWVLDEHRIQGRPAVPGTTYLEMVRAAFVSLAGPGPVEIRDLMFLTPVMVPDATLRELRVTLEEAGDAWSFRITSADRPDGPWTEHARGSAARGAGGEPEPVELEALRSRCSREVIEVSGGDLLRAEKLVQWGPRWESLRRVHLGDGEAVVRLELPEEFAADVERLELHPALVDVATAIGGGAVAEGSFLPLSYRRIAIRGALPPRFDSHIRTRGDVGKETVTLDVTLLGAAGERLVEVEGFTMKRVVAEGRIGAERAPAPEASDQEPRSLFGSSGMAPAEGVEALRRVLAHGRHPQIAISPRDLAWLVAQTRLAPSLDLAGGASGQPVRPSHPRPELVTPYLAPRTELEQTLAGIWAATLGVAEVGIHDNFFDLGGDSILGIQIITRAGEAGIRLAPELLFEHQTVAELAERLDGAAAGSGAAERWEEWLRAQAAGPWQELFRSWPQPAEPGEAELALPAAGAEGAREVVTTGLEAEPARRLLDEALPELRATLEEVVLAALVRAVTGRRGGDRLLVRLAGDGRRVAPPEVGLAEAETPLPFVFPTLIDLGGTGSSVLDLVRTVKEQRRAVPASGAAWVAALRYGPDRAAAERLAAAPAPRVALTVGEPAAEGSGELAAPALELRVQPGGPRLELGWAFDPSVLSREEVEALAGETGELLDRIGRDSGPSALSPSDFPEAELDEAELEKVLSKATE